jgi:histidinol-phosphate aminotransferase
MSLLSWHLQGAHHGGPDALGAVLFDFSTNANACGPCPDALNAVQAANAAHYPDPAYIQLRVQLAQWHGVEPARVLLAASASEFIFRISAWAASSGLTDVWLPPHSYGDYARAATALRLRPAERASASALAWLCDPCSPLGQASQALDACLASGAVVVLDRAYEPLRLQGAACASADQLDRVWQLWTPNKALGLTGVRAAYAIAPLHAQQHCAQLELLCPSWPVGAHGVAMLAAWVQPQVQQWAARSLVTLRAWKARQLALCSALGWVCTPSEANFFCVKPAQPLPVEALRARGIKLRSCASFGLPQHWRLSVQPPAAQDALEQAMKELT